MLFLMVVLLGSVGYNHLFAGLLHSKANRLDESNIPLTSGFEYLIFIHDDVLMSLLNPYIFLNTGDASIIPAFDSISNLLTEG
jgi:hypothetical protein